MDPVITQSLPLLLYAIFFGAAALSLVLGILLAYHWFKYSQNPAIATTALIVYSVVTSIFVLMLFAATYVLHDSL